MHLKSKISLIERTKSTTKYYNILPTIPSKLRTRLIILYYYFVVVNTISSLIFTQNVLCAMSI